LLIAGIGACNEQPALLPTSAATSTPAEIAIGLPVQNWLALGQYGVGNLGCPVGGLVWTTGSQPITKQNHRNDLLEFSARAGSQPRSIATATHGGTLTDALPSSGPWVVYLEYQQQGLSTNANFWYLNAVNTSSGAVVVLAGATTAAQLTELPWYDAGDGHAVWNQLDANGLEVLRLFDFSTEQSTTLPLPTNMSPVEPAISGNSVVFVDNATDPNRAREDFFGRRGSLRKYDLATNKVTTLSSDPTAFAPRISNGTVVWTTTSLGPDVVASTALQGGPVRIVGGQGPITPQTNGSIIAWYDSGTHHFMTYALKSGKISLLQVGTWPDVRSVFAVCGNRLFFALPPATDGGNSSVRYVDLPPIAQLA
jgi:hypothetical protein